MKVATRDHIRCRGIRDLDLPDRVKGLMCPEKGQLSEKLVTALRGVDLEKLILVEEGL